MDYESNSIIINMYIWLRDLRFEYPTPKCFRIQKRKKKIYKKKKKNMKMLDQVGHIYYFSHCERDVGNFGEELWGIYKFTLMKIGYWLYHIITLQDLYLYATDRYI